MSAGEDKATESPASTCSFSSREVNKSLEAFSGGQGKVLENVGEVFHLQIQQVILQPDPRIQQFLLLLLILNVDAFKKDHAADGGG